MRKQNLKVGEEYAAGSSSKYDRFRLTRVRLVDLDGERERRTTWGRVQTVRGIVVALVDKSDAYHFTGNAGEEKVLKDGRGIRMPWADYAKAKAEFDERQGRAKAESARLRDLADETQLVLMRLGVSDYARSGSDFWFTADQMAALAARIPDGHTTG